MKWYSICSVSVTLDSTLIFTSSAVEHFSSTDGCFLWFRNIIIFLLPFNLSYSVCTLLVILNSRNESCVMLQGGKLTQKELQECSIQAVQYSLDQGFRRKVDIATSNHSDPFLISFIDGPFEIFPSAQSCWSLKICQCKEQKKKSTEAADCPCRLHLKLQRQTSGMFLVQLSSFASHHPVLFSSWHYAIK